MHIIINCGLLLHDCSLLNFLVALSRIVSTHDCNSKLARFLSNNWPFIFLQVGGHCKLIKLSNGTIGKPLILREAQMYQVRPSKIAPFMANYKGSNFDHHQTLMYANLMLRYLGTISLSGQGELHHNR